MKTQANTSTSDSSTPFTMFVKRASLVVLGVFYLYAAVLQLNDPDSLFWIAIYCFAATLTIARAFGKISPIISGIYGLMCFSASAFLLITSTNITSDTLGHIFEHEEGRESGGLFIIALGMLLAYTTETGRSKHSAADRVLNLLAVLGLMIGLCAIGAAYSLPGYYNRIGVPIPEHCGGLKQEL